MRALVFDGDVHVDEAFPAPTPASGEALIRVSLAGICSTDLEILRGYKGFSGVLGHEFVGEVIAGSDKLTGQRVCGEINVSCKSCEECWHGLPTHCRNRSVIGILNRQGAFAEYLSLPLENLYPVPDSVDNADAVFAEPLAAAFQIPQQVTVEPGEPVLVLGDGRLGILCAQVLHACGARTTLAGKHQRKLQITRDLGITTYALTSAPGDYVVDLQRHFGVIVDATGSPRGLEMAITLSRPRGTIVLKSTYASRGDVDLTGIAVKELTVVGSRCGPFPRALDALAQGRVVVSPLVDAVHPLSDGIAALARAGQPGVLKVLIDPSR